MHSDLGVDGEVDGIEKVHRAARSEEITKDFEQSSKDLFRVIVSYRDVIEVAVIGAP
jgi:hypothetical protein